MVPRSSQEGIPVQGASPLSDSGHSNYEVSDDLSFRNPNPFHESSSSQTIDSTVHDTENTATISMERITRRSDTEEESIRNTHHQRTSSLPEDDGMGELRRQILAIQAMDIRSEQKARLMHQLLTRNYFRSQELSNEKKQEIIYSPSNTTSQERSTITPISLTSFFWQMNGSSESSVEEKKHDFKLSANDLNPSYVPPDGQECEDCGDVGIKDETLILGCKHYKRNVKLECSACYKWYTCRLCHDEVEDHVLNRKATKHMLCMLCGCAQKAAAFCIECGERTAWYYCNVCKLWDNDSKKSIYHCNDCGICRKGLGIGKDFFHCKTCGTCMSMSVEHSHKCIERVSDCDCPICGEYMFTSPTPVVFMLCGHGIHKVCYDEYIKSSYKCPICSKSTINMEAQFRNLDRAVVSQPMPPQFRDTKAMVSCNDCHAKSAVKYHWLGLKCAICDSYNTAQLSILSDPVCNSSDQGEGDAINSSTNNSIRDASTIYGPGMVRERRHSTFLQQEGPNNRFNRISSLQRPQRASRSASPVSRAVFFDQVMPQVVETDDSAVEDDALDFWGLDEPRSVTSGENVDEEIEEDTDEDSGLEDCDDGEEDEDDFALFGHR